MEIFEFDFEKLKVYQKSLDTGMRVCFECFKAAEFDQRGEIYTVAQ